MNIYAQCKDGGLTSWENRTLCRTIDHADTKTTVCVTTKNNDKESGVNAKKIVDDATTATNNVVKNNQPKIMDSYYYKWSDDLDVSTSGTFGAFK